VGYVHINLKDKLPLISLQPEKTEYKITDEEFIWEKCEKINLTNISIYLPKGWKISSVAHSDGLAWDLFFLHKRGDKIETFVVLNSEGSQPYFGGISNTLKFDSVYDFEKKLNYSKHSPLYLTMKTLGNPEELNSIEEVKTPSWKGFVKINKKRKRNRILFESSLHSLDEKQSARFTLLLDEDYMTAVQARNIIASFQFEDTLKEADVFFKEGKKALLKNRYRKAILHFINANAQDDKNPKYLYYLALSLYEDDSKTGRKMRLVSSENFLRKILELKPNYQKAEKLLLLVKEEIKQIDD
jgi:tetratricopeptide (TPR) repeat protein